MSTWWVWITMLIYGWISIGISYDFNGDKWLQDGHNLLERNVKTKVINRKAKGVILFVGDGMGISTVTAARIYEGQLKGMTGEENVLSWEHFPNSALSKTYCVDRTTTDSAASATAFLTGVKTNNGVLSLNSSVVEWDCAAGEEKNKVLSLIMLSEKEGLSTGVVTTTRVTHATPAAAYANSASRDYEAVADAGCKDIASQLVEFPYGDGLEVVLGGGRKMFHSNASEGGSRNDGRNLIQEWKNKSPKNIYITEKSQLKDLDPTKDERVIGLFTDSTMSFSYHRRNSSTQPSLIEMVDFAIKKLKTNTKGYVLLVEAGRIDHGHHGNLPYHALYDTIELHETVALANKLTDPKETLIIVTADHSHVFTIGGYQPRGTPLFNYTTKSGTDGKKMTTIGYYNGPGAVINKTREVPDLEELKEPDYRWESTLIPLRSETHGAEDVGVYAQGCQSHLMRGVVESTYIFQVMDYALCLTPEKRRLCESEGLLRETAKQNNNSTRPTECFLTLLFLLAVVNSFTA